MTCAETTASAERFLDVGHAYLPEVTDAWATAQRVFAATRSRDEIGSGMPALEVVGEFVLPPATTAARDYQLLHIDFGLPVRPLGPVDVARFTALHVDATHPPTRARTRLVPLRSLLGQRSWVEPSALHARVRRGAAAGPDGGSHVEGVLARLVEDARDDGILLTSDDKNSPGC